MGRFERIIDGLVAAVDAIDSVGYGKDREIRRLEEDLRRCQSAKAKLQSRVGTLEKTVWAWRMAMCNVARELGVEPASPVDMADKSRRVIRGLYAQTGEWKARAKAMVESMNNAEQHIARELVALGYDEPDDPVVVAIDALKRRTKERDRARAGVRLHLGEMTPAEEHLDLANEEEP